MLDRRNFMKTCSGMGLAEHFFRSVMGAAAGAGCEKDHKEMMKMPPPSRTFDFGEYKGDDA